MPSQEERFGIGGRAKSQRGTQLSPQLTKVVDLPVEGDPLPAIARPHRHAPACRPVNDGQPARSEHHRGGGSESGICADMLRVKTPKEGENLRVPLGRAGQEKSPVIGSAVNLRIEHSQYRGDILDRDWMPELEDAGNSAHGGRESLEARGVLEEGETNRRRASP